MEQAQSMNSTEQRRRLLKGALGASTVMSMGYSSAALASFQCITSTTPYPSSGPGFKKSINTTSNWAWLKLQVFSTNKSNSTNSWKAVKIPNGTDPTVANGDTGTSVYFFDNLATTPLLYAAGSRSLPSGIKVSSAESGNYVYVIVYFKVDGSIAGFFPTYTPITGSDYPAQGSCLTSLNPNLVQTNIFYGG